MYLKLLIIVIVFGLAGIAWQLSELKKAVECAGLRNVQASDPSLPMIDTITERACR